HLTHPNPLSHPALHPLCGGARARDPARTVRPCAPVRRPRGGHAPPGSTGVVRRGRGAVHGPPLVEWLLGTLSAPSGAYGLHRARAGAAGERRAAYGDALMGLGMAVMALPAVTSAGRAWGAGVFTAVFAAAGLYAVGSYATGTCAAGTCAAG